MPPAAPRLNPILERRAQRSIHSAIYHCLTPNVLPHFLVYSMKSMMLLLADPSLSHGRD
jgi:hypothetical protein